MAERSKAAFATRLKTHAQKIASAVDGDVWDELRLRYDTGEEVFDYSWLCPFTRDQVLDIGSAKDFDDVRSLMQGAKDDFAGHQTKKDIQYVWRLMKKYYVSDEDTHMGRMHLETLLGFDRGMQAMLPAIDEAADENIDEMNRLFDEETERLEREQERERERHQRYHPDTHTYMHPPNIPTPSYILSHLTYSRTLNKIPLSPFYPSTRLPFCTLAPSRYLDGEDIEEDDPASKEGEGSDDDVTLPPAEGK